MNIRYPIYEGVYRILTMKLFDYHNWYQLTYPSFGNVDRKWEQELQEIICRLSAA